MGTVMSTLTLHIKTKDYSAWRPYFDAFEKNRVSAGVTNARVFRKAEDANDILVLFDVADISKARSFLTSDELKAQMQKAGVLGPPTPYFSP
jgi:hypothetical protein